MHFDLLTQFWLLLAGVGGAFLPLAIGQGASSRGRALAQVACGALMATFFAPALEEHFFSTSPAQVNAAISFFIGCFGLKLTELSQKLIDSRGEALANRLIDRIAGPDENKSPGSKLP